MMRSTLAFGAFLLASLPAVALADVTVTFSPGVDQILGGDPAASEQETQLQDALNSGLNGVGSGDIRVRRSDVPDGATADGLRQLARDLSASNQTIRILCREEAQELGKTDPVMQRLFEQSEPNPQGGGGAATMGDFGRDGKPRQGGTMIIVIECGRLGNGWFRPMVEGGITMLHTLGHELVHAADRANVHGDRNTAEEPYYDGFGALVQRTALAAYRRAQREKEKAEKAKKEKAQTPVVPPCEDEH